MSLQLDVEQIELLMKSFYTLTGIRFVLFDADLHERIAYPKDNGAFCKLMKQCPRTRRKCRYADRRSFETCEKVNSLVVYKCHAGLVEAVMPLHENGKIIGYLMFGQIVDSQDRSNLYEHLALWRDVYGIDGNALSDSIEKIPFKTEEHIRAAATIMEACTSFIIYKELIRPKGDQLLEAVKTYIDAHLDEAIDAASLCRTFRIGRTRLYEIFREQSGMGVSQYILRRRMHRAKKLLKTTELSIPEIADAVGFADYNYFSRVFKKTYDKPPKSYRK